MNILIDHVGFENKGAELMLRFIVIELKKSLPLVQLVLKKHVYEENIAYCAENNILPLRGNLKTIKSKIWHVIIKQRRYVLVSEIDAIIDAAGLRFTDEAIFYQDKTKQLQQYYNSFTKPGCKFIFMPQSFGPFNLTFSQQQIDIVHQKATVLYAREETSYNHLIARFPQSSKIKMSPDFTCLYKPQVPMSKIIPDKKMVLIVPNVRMITHGEQSEGQYMEFLVAITNYLIKKGESVVLLNHQGLPDEQLLIELNAKITSPLPIISNLNADEVKSIIGRAKLLITSRFHGLESGLSQAIPCLCTGWSHKYLEALRDYGMSESLLLNISTVDNAITTIQDAIENPTIYTAKKEKIENLEKQASAMWQDVLSLLQQ
jgi:polysaccharide pyruvyl transferase WcaK-like protein